MFECPSRFFRFALGGVAQATGENLVIPLTIDTQIYFGIKGESQRARLREKKRACKYHVPTPKMYFYRIGAKINYFNEPEDYLEEGLF